MANLSFALTISDLCISSVPPLTDHAFLIFNLPCVPKLELAPPPPPKIIMIIHFNHSYDDIYIEKLKSYLNHIHTIQDPIERTNFFLKHYGWQLLSLFPIPLA